jgi:hypothetical protein
MCSTNDDKKEFDVFSRTAPTDAAQKAKIAEQAALAEAVAVARQWEAQQRAATAME